MHALPNNQITIEIDGKSIEKVKDAKSLGLQGNWRTLFKGRTYERNEQEHYRKDKKPLKNVFSFSWSLAWVSDRAKNQSDCRIGYRALLEKKIKCSHLPQLIDQVGRTILDTDFEMSIDSATIRKADLDICFYVFSFVWQSVALNIQPYWKLWFSYWWTLGWHSCSYSILETVPVFRKTFAGLEICIWFLSRSSGVW